VVLLPCAGNFIVYFMGSVSRAINIHSTAAQVKAIMEDVQTIGVVNVVRTETTQSTVAPLSRYGVHFTVTFVENKGDVPSLLVSALRSTRVGTVGGGAHLLGLTTSVPPPPSPCPSRLLHNHRSPRTWTVPGRTPWLQAGP
jgi:hypothetical protein